MPADITPIRISVLLWSWGEGSRICFLVGFLTATNQVEVAENSTCLKLRTEVNETLKENHTDKNIKKLKNFQRYNYIDKYDSR